jgi:hypothetical protein
MQQQSGEHSEICLLAGHGVRTESKKETSLLMYTLQEEYDNIYK